MPKSIARGGVAGGAEELELPDNLRPYKAHGLPIKYRKGMTSVDTDCPFCGRAGKFNIHVATSMWRCNVCNEGFEKQDASGHVKAIRGGNSVEFLRMLWKYSDEQTTDYSELVADRGLLGPDVLIRWEVVRSITTGEWLVPGYNAKGSLTQLYIFRNLLTKGRWKRTLIPTAKMGEMGGYSLFGMKGFDPKRPVVDVFESWNGVAAEEVMRLAFEEADGQWTEADSPRTSVAADRNVIGVPGCGIWHESWRPLFQGKTVNFWFDNDHPKEHPKLKDRVNPPVGWTYSVRNATALNRVADEVGILQWGDEGFDLSLPTGYDVRDHLKRSDEVAERISSLHELSTKIVSWQDVEATSASGEAVPVRHSDRLGVMACDKYRDLLMAWRKALKWRQELDDVLSTLLSVCVSTEQVGDQLFLMLIADAGSAKTRFCDALLTSEGCHALEHLTGFHSGWKGDGNGGYALLDRINRKTLITPEGDVLMSNPAFVQIMSQQRRIFDGKSSASYKHMKEDQSFSGLRTPWIIAGTPALLDTDQAKLGDRFLKVFMAQPDGDERRQILMRVAHSARAEVKQHSAEAAEGQLTPEMRDAYRMTGGYVDWLRSNTELLGEVGCEDSDLERCAMLGEFAAAFRARPSKKGDETHDSKEMPTRLTKQAVRLAICSAVVMNKSCVDAEVMRRVRKVMVDTGSGHTLTMASLMHKVKADGATPEALNAVIGKSRERSGDLLKFLSVLDVAKAVRPIDPQTGNELRARWWLTEQADELYQKVMIEWHA